MSVLKLPEHRRFYLSTVDFQLAQKTTTHEHKILFLRNFFEIIKKLHNLPKSEITTQQPDKSHVQGNIYGDLYKKFTTNFGFSKIKI